MDTLIWGLCFTYACRSPVQMMLGRIPVPSWFADCVYECVEKGKPVSCNPDELGRE